MKKDNDNGDTLLGAIKQAFSSEQPSRTMIGNRGEQETAKPFKLIIEFNGVGFDFFDLVRYEKFEPYSKDSETGLAYGIRLTFKSYPFNKEFVFPSEEKREEQQDALAGKLEQAGAVIK